MSLFTFDNVFDGIAITLDDESGESKGPFIVTFESTDEAISSEFHQHSFDSLKDAKVKFMELVSDEIDAVLDQQQHA